jgi:hypothetical protein
MADFLDGKVYRIDAAVAGLAWSFTVDLPFVTQSTPGFTLADCLIFLRLYPLVDRGKTLQPISNTPAVTLSLGSGLTRMTNADPLLDGNRADTQIGTLVITPQQCTTLIAGGTYRFVGYEWRATLASGGIVAAPTQQGEKGPYEGKFGLTLPGISGEALALIKAGTA